MHEIYDSIWFYFSQQKMFIWLNLLENENKNPSLSNTNPSNLNQSDFQSDELIIFETVLFNSDINYSMFESFKLGSVETSQLTKNETDQTSISESVDLSLIETQADFLNLIKYDENVLGVKVNISSCIYNDIIDLIKHGKNVELEKLSIRFEKNLGAGHQKLGSQLGPPVGSANGSSLADPSKPFKMVNIPVNENSLKLTKFSTVNSKFLNLKQNSNKFKENLLVKFYTNKYEFESSSIQDQSYRSENREQPIEILESREKLSSKNASLPDKDFLADIYSLIKLNYNFSRGLKFEIINGELNDVMDFDEIELVEEMEELNLRLGRRV